VRGIVLVVTFLLSASRLSAEWCEVPPSNPTDAYAFVISFIAANARIQQACELALQNGQPVSSKLGENILQLKRAKQELACAREILAPYAASPQVLIKATSIGTVRAIDALADSSDREIALNKTLLDAIDAEERGKPTGLSHSEMADVQSDIAVKEDSAWDLLDKATTGVIYCLTTDQAAYQAVLKGEKSNKKPDWRLLITAVQRHQLLAAFEQSFGADVTKGLKVDAKQMTSVQKGARALYQMLSSPKWKASDE
jgi:hypothetical protein